MTVSRLMDDMSTVMLERDALSTTNEQMTRKIDLMVREERGIQNALTVARTSRNEILDTLHRVENELQHTTQANEHLRKERKQLTVLHREVTLELTTALNNNSSNSTEQEENQNEIMKLTTLTQHTHQQLAKQTNALTHMERTHEQLAQVERRLRHQLTCSRNENDGLCETTSRIEKKLQTMTEEKNTQQLLFQKEEHQKDDLQIQFNQSAIVMRRLEDEVESLKTLLRSTSNKNQFWEKNEKPQLLATLSQLRLDCVAMREDGLRMEQAQDSMSVELRRVQGALDQVDVQRDDCQSTLDTTTIQFHQLHEEKQQLVLELQRMEVALQKTTHNNHQLSSLVENKNKEQSRLRSQLAQSIDQTQNTKTVHELQQVESMALRQDLKAMTMENQIVSTEACSRERERNGLLVRVEELNARLMQCQNDLEVSRRDREDLMTTYRMVIQERATLEHTVSQVGEQRDAALGGLTEQVEKEKFLRHQLTLLTQELQKYRIDLNEKERVTSELSEMNQHLNVKLNQTQHSVQHNQHTTTRAQNATAAMAADAETLRYDNARLLQLADAARIRIEELEHRLRVVEGQFASCTEQMLQMENMLSCERNERARSETQRNALQGQVMYQEGDEGEHIRSITKALGKERER